MGVHLFAHGAVPSCRPGAMRQRQPHFGLLCAPQPPCPQAQVRAQPGVRVLFFLLRDGAVVVLGVRVHLEGKEVGREEEGANTSNHGAQHLYNTPPLTRVGKCLLARVMEGFTPQLSPKRAVCVAAREEGKGVHARSFERLRSRGVNPCAAHLAEPALRQGLEVC